ncbi:MAG: acyltransferase [Dehalococcoidia bacterium]
MLRERLRELWWKVRWSSRATGWLHVLAMFAPFNSWRVFFHRLRGVRIGQRVEIVQGCFLEESRPWLITIEDDVKISAGATIVTHDMVYFAMDQKVPYRYGRVVLKRRCIVGPGSVILPGVTVGEGALVGAGAIVVKDVPSGTVVAGPAGSHLMNLDDGLERARLNIEEYRRQDRATKYPWLLDPPGSEGEETSP